LIFDSVMLRQLAHGVNEPIEIDRLLEVPRCLEPLGALQAVVRSGHADHRHVGVVWILKLALAELVAAHDRHHEIEQDDRGPRLLHAHERFGTIAGSLHVETFALEQDGEHLPQVRVIFDNEYGGHSGLLPPRADGRIRENATELLGMHTFDELEIASHLVAIKVVFDPARLRHDGLPSCSETSSTFLMWGEVRKF
jgi:hypothetical protein